MLEKRKLKSQGKIILFYGRPGVGKTSIIHGCPMEKKLFVELETTGFESSEVVRITRDELVAASHKDGVAAALDRLGELAVKEGYECISIDTIGALEDINMTYILNLNNWKTLSDGSFGAGHQRYRDSMNEIIHAIIKWSKMGLHVLLTSHTQMETIPEFDGTERLALSPKFGSMKAEKSPYRELLLGNTWIIAQVRPAIVESDDGKQRLQGIVIDCGVSPGSISKKRVDIPACVTIPIGGKSWWDITTPLLSK